LDNAVLLLALAIFTALSPRMALAWGEQGHKIVALIWVKAQVATFLAE
jgi:hypothetical protein